MVNCLVLKVLRLLTAGPRGAQSPRKKYMDTYLWLFNSWMWPYWQCFRACDGSHGPFTYEQWWFLIATLNNRQKVYMKSPPSSLWVQEISGRTSIPYHNPTPSGENLTTSVSEPSAAQAAASRQKYSLWGGVEKYPANLLPSMEM